MFTWKPNLTKLLVRGIRIFRHQGNIKDFANFVDRNGVHRILNILISRGVVEFVPCFELSLKLLEGGYKRNTKGSNGVETTKQGNRDALALIFAEFFAETLCFRMLW